jgi:hypothetical protein
MVSFDVRVFGLRRRPGRAAFEVRWRVAGRDRSRSFMTRALAYSYRAELIRAARRGLAFDPATGEPLAWAVDEAQSRRPQRYRLDRLESAHILVLNCEDFGG